MYIYKIIIKNLINCVVYVSGNRIFIKSIYITFPEVKFNFYFNLIKNIYNSQKFSSLLRKLFYIYINYCSN